ncbi:hypothetical protein E2562_025944 [Oryza meyeriana var. granulata]|uniref:Uncharacterized protein n=1 Tax=Oryza meyeriana var. granulata TaxID=110450 RepID=A0A6G1EYV0_9ORYZ|nr:hypothetical protein E2562_025944 [Oryza meyeriana var. granulata]
MAEPPPPPTPRSSSPGEERSKGEEEERPKGRPPPPTPELRLFDTRTKAVVPFKPRVEGKVGMYVCGVTPYDFSHVGHARAYIAFDVLYRYLTYLGYEVNYVRNFTDIDDKIMDNGKAYTIEGDVYFSVDNFPDYLCLSGRKLDHNLPGKRVAVDTRKRNPADFALWKSAKEGEPSWVSPWGRGRPGWHIECSAMSAYYLGKVFDIHGGGKDLIFPHHENELAQSQEAYPESEVKCWMHNGFVNKDGQKMAKADKNFFTIRDIISLYHPMALRHYMTALKQLKEKALKRAGMTAEQLQQLIEQRTLARKNKDFAESDRIRTELSALGIALMDEPTGTLWKPSEPELTEES